MRKFLYIYNPYSGQQLLGRSLDKIMENFEKRGSQVILHRLYTYENDDVLETYLADKDAFDGVIICGGDGTVGKIIDKLQKYGNQTPVGIVPGGTCNDFAGNLKMPSDPARFVSIFCDYNVKKVDLLKISKDDQIQYICNSIASGMMVSVSHTTSTDFKKAFGSVAYYISALGNLNYIKPFGLKVTTDIGIIDTSALIVCVLNGSDVGGIKDVLTQADITDGKMNVIIVRECLFPEQAAAGIAILSHKPDKNTITFECKKCRIEIDRELGVSLDGDDGLKMPFEVECAHNALNVIVPEDTADEKR